MITEQSSSENCQATNNDNQSTSKRNLMTILEAIWHLEGTEQPVDKDQRSSDSPMVLVSDDSETDTDIETQSSIVHTPSTTISQSQHPNNIQQYVTLPPSHLSQHSSQQLPTLQHVRYLPEGCVIVPNHSNLL